MSAKTCARRALFVNLAEPVSACCVIAAPAQRRLTHPALPVNQSFPGARPGATARDGRGPTAARRRAYRTTPEPTLNTTAAACVSRPIRAAARESAIRDAIGGRSPGAAV